MTAPNTDSSHPETLAFVAPGFIHRLGNLMFTVQGHAQLLTGSEGSDREVTAISTAAERGGRILRVLRTLLGATSEPPENATELFEVTINVPPGLVTALMGWSPYQAHDSIPLHMVSSTLMVTSTLVAS